MFIRSYVIFMMFTMVLLVNGCATVDKSLALEVASEAGIDKGLRDYTQEELQRGGGINLNGSALQTTSAVVGVGGLLTGAFDVAGMGAVYFLTSNAPESRLPHILFWVPENEYPDFNSIEIEKNIESRIIAAVKKSLPTGFFLEKGVNNFGRNIYKLKSINSAIV